MLKFRLLMKANSPNIKLGLLPKIVSSLLGLLCLAAALSAQEIPEIVNYRANEQGMVDQNWMITQSCEGDLFVANSSGIFRFNGFRWTRIPFFRNGRVRAVYTGSDCKIYCGGYESFGVLEKEGLDYVYRELSDPAFQEHDEEIWHITGNESRILFQSFSEIYEYDFDELRYIDPEHNILFGSYADDRFIFPLIDENGFAIYDEGNLSVTLADSGRNPYKIVGISEFDGKLLLATEKNGLFYFHGTRLQPLGDEKLKNMLARDRVNRILALSDGNLVVGTLLNGIYILDADFNPLIHINREAGLSNNTVLSLFEDKTGDFWVGTNDGVNQILWSSPDRFYYDRKDEIGVIFAHVFFEGEEYFGTNKGLFKGNGAQGFENVPELNGQVWALWTDGTGELLVGHNDGTFSIRGGEVLKISEVTGGQKMQLISPDSMIQATYTGWLLFTKKNSRWHFDKRIPGSRLLLESFLLSGREVYGFNSNEGLVRQVFSEDFSTVLTTHSVRGENAPAYFQSQKFKEENGRIYFTVEDRLFEIRDTVFGELDLPLGDVFSAAELFLDSSIRPIHGGYARIGSRERLPVPDSVFVDYLTVNGREVTLKEGKTTLGSNTNSLKVQLGRTSFGNHEEDLYYSFSSESNSVWTKIPANGEIVLNEPKANTYKLLAGNQKDMPLELFTITILPRWYQSTAGYIGFLLLGISLIFLAGRRQKIKSRAILQEKERHLEKTRILAANHRLEQEINHKSQMLANSTMTIIQKNKMLNELKDYVSQELKAISGEKEVKNRLVRMINRNINSDQDWQIFQNNFNQIHQDFMERLKGEFPELSSKDLQLAAYIRMGLQSKEIAPLLNVSDRSIDNNRYRLRKKLGLDPEDNLREFVVNF